MTPTVASPAAATLSIIESCGVVAVIRMHDAAKLHRVIDALARAGVRALEITMTVPGAIDLIAEIAPSLPEGFVVGAGTVLDAATAERAARAGARFVVSPVCRRDIVDAAHRHGAAAVPGCFTPTEILTAWEWGADIVKVFPATALGPGYIRDVRAPLPELKLMPTGGVTLDNVREWIAAGAAAIGVGTAIIDAKAVAADDFEAVLRRAELFVDAVAAARRGLAV